MNSYHLVVAESGRACLSTVSDLLSLPESIVHPTCADHNTCNGYCISAAHAEPKPLNYTNLRANAIRRHKEGER